jgi:serine/threonine protein kinase
VTQPEGRAEPPAAGTAAAPAATGQPVTAQQPAGADRPADTAVFAATHAQAPPEPPDIPAADALPDLDGLECLSTIGAGASAVVYKVTASAHPGPFALKVWHQPLDDEERRRFDHECRLHRALSGHPNIVRFLDGAAPEGRQAWIATELCDESLDDRLHHESAPTLTQVYAWAGDLLAGLAEIHRLGHVHRDVKPSNVLLIADRAVLCDLGIARPAGAHTRNASAGTPGYLAPELGRGNQPDHATDVYSAANTIYAMLPGDIPAGLDSLLTRASSSHPSDRPSDAAVFLEMFRGAALAPGGDDFRENDRRGPQGTTPPDAKGAGPGRGNRGKKIRGLLALVAVATGAGAYVLAGGPTHLTDGAVSSGTTTTPAFPLRTAIPTPRPGTCLNHVSAPRNVTTTRFDLTVRITCPVPAGNIIRLVSMVKGTTPYPVEYWIKDDWAIDNRQGTQHFMTIVSKGVTRTYFLISATPAHLQAIRNEPGNLQPDGSGYRSLGDLLPVSNAPVNTQIPG